MFERASGPVREEKMHLLEREEKTSMRRGLGSRPGKGMFAVHTGKVRQYGPYMMSRTTRTYPLFVGDGVLRSQSARRCMGHDM